MEKYKPLHFIYFCSSQSLHHPSQYKQVFRNLLSSQPISHILSHCHFANLSSQFRFHTLLRSKTLSKTKPSIVIAALAAFVAARPSTTFRDGYSTPGTGDRPSFHRHHPSSQRQRPAQIHPSTSHFNHLSSSRKWTNVPFSSSSPLPNAREPKALVRERLAPLALPTNTRPPSSSFLPRAEAKFPLLKL